MTKYFIYYIVCIIYTLVYVVFVWTEKSQMVPFLLFDTVRYITLSTNVFSIIDKKPQLKFIVYFTIVKMFEIAFCVMNKNKSAKSILFNLDSC